MLLPPHDVRVQWLELRRGIEPADRDTAQQRPLEWFPVCHRTTFALPSQVLQFERLDEYWLRDLAQGRLFRPGPL